MLDLRIPKVDATSGSAFVLQHLQKQDDLDKLPGNLSLPLTTHGALRPVNGAELVQDLYNRFENGSQTLFFVVYLNLAQQAIRGRLGPEPVRLQGECAQSRMCLALTEALPNGASELTSVNIPSSVHSQRPELIPSAAFLPGGERYDGLKIRTEHRGVEAKASKSVKNEVDEVASATSSFQSKVNFKLRRTGLIFAVPRCA
ncbi:hypothetical protein C8R46DRAFT_1039965 [Mycena filopes]|nr:hypothetical protein C8R46DRAFT_1039965 [Mycena filopes]